MKIAQIDHYSKNINVQIVDAPIPTINKNEVLVKVKVAAVNPLDILNITGDVKLIQNYSMPLILGNELTGVIEAVGDHVSDFKVGDEIYGRLPVSHIGAFAEYVAIDANAIWYMPEHLNFIESAAIPLTGLTAYQGLIEELDASPGQSVFISGGSGSFGQIAIPIAKSMGLTVIVSGGTDAKEFVLSLGANQYIDYKKENYWEVLNSIDYVIDTLGASEFDHELSIIKPGGKLLSLKAGPNKQFAIDRKYPKWKQLLFGLAGNKFDKKAQEKDISYRFIFVRANGKQLKHVTQIIEKIKLVPKIDPTPFKLEDINQALNYVNNGHPKGKVVIMFD